MKPWIIFLLSLSVLLLIIWILNHFFNLLKDDSIRDAKRPYSFARVQLTWWTTIILASIISTFAVTLEIPTLDESTLILLGVSSVTFAFARTIEVSDDSNLDNPAAKIQNDEGKNLVVDILSDGSGISVHRFQAAIFNLIFGCWFAYYVISQISSTNTDPDLIFPIITGNNLILLGLSSATYAALKANENN